MTCTRGAPFLDFPNPGLCAKARIDPCRAPTRQDRLESVHRTSARIAPTYPVKSTKMPQHGSMFDIGSLERKLVA